MFQSWSNAFNNKVRLFRGCDLLLRPQRLLFNYVKSNWRLYATAITLTMIANIVQSYYPKIIGNFTDQLQRDQMTRTAIIDYSLFLLGIGLIFGLFAGTGQYMIMW